jgi:hypothetical protein
MARTVSKTFCITDGLVNLEKKAIVFAFKIYGLSSGLRVLIIASLQRTIVDQFVSKPPPGAMVVALWYVEGGQ